MSRMDGQPVLVTGGAGFIGSHLVEDLVARGATVTVLDDLSTGRRANLDAVLDRIEVLPIDLRTDDPRPLLAERRFARVFHLAGNVHVLGSVEDPRRDFERNALGTFNLLEAMREASPGSALIYTSSAAVYGEGLGKTLREDGPTFPVGPYATSKLCAERYVSVYPRVYDMRTVSVRLFPVYGPRLRRQVVYDLIAKVHVDPTTLPIRGDGTQERDFNHVSNVVEALLLVAEKAPMQGEVFNVAGLEVVSIRELAEQICRLLDVKPTFAFSGSVKPGEANRWTADTTKLRALGYRPRVSFAEGLKDTVAWFLRSHGS